MLDNHDFKISMIQSMYVVTLGLFDGQIMVIMHCILFSVVTDLRSDDKDKDLSSEDKDKDL